MINTTGYSEIPKKMEALAADTKKAIEEELDARKPAVFRDFGIYQRQIIERLFRETVGEFYTDYEPTQYHRTHGLYDILDPQIDSDGTVVMDEASGYSELYNADAMDGHRLESRRLYQTVFVEGYHGGAASVSGDKAGIWGHHPSPGRPYYRRWGMVTYPDGTTKGHRYGRWGSPAERAEVSPYSNMYSKAYNSKKTEMLSKLKELAQVSSTEGVKQVAEEVFPNLVFKYFGKGGILG